MNDAKQNYAAVAESEFDLRREVVRLRDINKELLEALCDCMKDSFTAADGMSQSGKRSFAGERYRKAVTAIAKAEGR